jgi:Oligoribonuclease (3'->5' exoribonuclease)
MTGLNPIKDHIIEIATIVTNADLEIVARGPDIAIHQAKKILENMDEWNTEHHSQSGLWQRVLDSDISVREAERITLDFLKDHVPIIALPCVVTVSARTGVF